MPPPRQRQGGKKPKTKEGSSGSSEEGRGRKEKEESSGEEGRPGEQRRRKKSGVSWTPVLKRLGIFVLVISIPAILNYAALNQEARMLVPAGGVRYDIGWNQKLMLKCTGQGLPTVILEAPVGQSSDVWVLVESLIAKKTKVCVYDRAGLGFSDRAYQNTSLYANDFSEAAMDRDRTMPSTVERMADDLHRLISSASNQPKPVLLVSLDFATLVSRFYTQLYEHEVAGLLLIDPAFEMLFDAMDDTAANSGDDPSDDAPRPLTWHKYWYERIIPSANGVWLSAVIGFNRLSLMVGLTSPMEKPELVKLLPKEVVQRKKYLTCQPKHVQSVIYEYLYMNESMHQMKTVLKVKPFPEHLPVTIATYQQVEQNLEPELSKVWMAGQEQLMKNIHPDSRHIVLPGSDYLTLFTHPRPVANAVLNMVDRWRRDSKLSA